MAWLGGVGHRRQRAGAGAGAEGRGAAGKRARAAERCRGCWSWKPAAKQRWVTSASSRSAPALVTLPAPALGTICTRAVLPLRPTQIQRDPMSTPPAVPPPQALPQHLCPTCAPLCPLTQLAPASRRHCRLTARALPVAVAVCACVRFCVVCDVYMRGRVCVCARAYVFSCSCRRLQFGRWVAALEEAITGIMGM